MKRVDPGAILLLPSTHLPPPNTNKHIHCRDNNTMNESNNNNANIMTKATVNNEKKNEKKILWLNKSKDGIYYKHKVFVNNFP